MHCAHNVNNYLFLGSAPIAGSAKDADADPKYAGGRSAHGEIYAWVRREVLVEGRNHGRQLGSLGKFVARAETDVIIQSHL
jgi:hypothetical protein